MKMGICGLVNLAAQTYWMLSDPNVKSWGKSFIWLTKDENEALKVWRCLEFWQKTLNGGVSGNAGAPIRPATLLILENPQFSVSLFKFLKGSPGIYILPFTYWNDLKVTASVLRASSIILKKSQKTTPGKVREQLVSLDYEAGGEGEKGTFKQRGGNLTVSPVNWNESIRLEFDEEKIVSIKLLDEFRKDLSELEIFPAKLENLATKFNKISSLVVLPAENVFIYQDPEILKELSSEWQEMNEEVNRADNIIFHSFHSGQYQDLNFKAAKKYQKNFPAFLKDFGQRQRQGWQIFLSVPDTAVIYNLFKSSHQEILPNTRVAAFRPELEGFINEKLKTWFLTPRELFGALAAQTETKQGKKKKRRVDWGFFSNLKAGDYVVHEDHGIARFGGLVKTTLNGESKELFLLQYADNDKLYVPVELAYKIDKYIGQAHPTIHKLSGTGWSQITKKVKEEALKLAENLLNLYAQRQMVQIQRWQKTFSEEKDLARRFLYKETPDQETAINEVSQDLEKTQPMDRLVVGDVGFGKTEVAIRAAFKAVMNRKQVAVLAPTTILVQQHFDTFRERLKDFPVVVEGLSRFTAKLEGSKKEKEVLAGLGAGVVDIVIGTSRLLSPDIKFKDLGLIIIDEEQKFGVRHKEKLKMLRTQAHVLTLSATPIPRTLYLSLSGLRNVSSIATPPPGRKEIETTIAQYSDELVKEAINKELKRGGQVYYLYNKVASIPLAVKRLKGLLGGRVRVGVVHGQLPEEEIAKSMSLFDSGQIDVLVCSSIIENGLDLPNVNTLIVEDSTRFGLGQLYQFRGRIGRGLVQAHAYFMYTPQNLRGLSGERLRALQEARALGSGYQLALRDLEMRGVGNILGKEQHGYVAEVGLSTYLRLLDQAMTEVGQGILIEPAEVKINLPFVVGISENLLPDTEKRIQLYRQFALINNLDDLAVEIIKFKRQVDNKIFDFSTQNFFDLLKLKILAEKAKVKSIDYSQIMSSDGKLGRLTVEFLSIQADALADKFAKNGWQIEGKIAKIRIKSIDRQFLHDLIFLLS